VKELRLQRISTVDAANAFMPTFIDDYNRRFGKLPRDRHDAHRPIRKDEDLNAIFAWREYRKVTDSLTLRYERKMYLIQDTPSNRRLIGKYIEVFQFPDGRIEIRVAGESLPYSTYDKLGTIDQGAIVDNKRLSHVLRTSQIVQAARDNRVVFRPSTAHRADGTPIPKNKLVGTKRQRDLSEEDLHSAIKEIKRGKPEEKEGLPAIEWVKIDHFSIKAWAACRSGPSSEGIPHRATRTIGAG
jgi:hypothetical protein